jgi:hypothetical protein
VEPRPREVPRLQPRHRLRGAEKQVTSPFRRVTREVEAGPRAARPGRAAVLRQYRDRETLAPMRGGRRTGERGDDQVRMAPRASGGGCDPNQRAKPGCGNEPRLPARGAQELLEPRPLSTEIQDYAGAGYRHPYRDQDDGRECQGVSDHDARRLSGCDRGGRPPDGMSRRSTLSARKVNTSPQPCA